MKFDRATAKRWLGTQWPTTILRDRYDGVYSGGRWTAFPIAAEAVPAEVSGQDVPCRTFWDTNRMEKRIPVGVGTTVDEAIQQLNDVVAQLAGDSDSDD